MFFLIEKLVVLVVRNSKVEVIKPYECKQIVQREVI